MQLETSNTKIKQGLKSCIDTTAEELHNYTDVIFDTLHSTINVTIELDQKEIKEALITINEQYSDIEDKQQRLQGEVIDFATTADRVIE